jgi:hypothetical protein
VPPPLPFLPRPGPMEDDPILSCRDFLFPRTAPHQWMPRPGRRVVAVAFPNRGVRKYNPSVQPTTSSPVLLLDHSHHHIIVTFFPSRQCAGHGRAGASPLPAPSVPGRGERRCGVWLGVPGRVHPVRAGGDGGHDATSRTATCPTVSSPGSGPACPWMVSSTIRALLCPRRW